MDINKRELLLEEESPKVIRAKECSCKVWAQVKENVLVYTRLVNGSRLEPVLH